MHPNRGRFAITDLETGEHKGWRDVHVRLRNGWTSLASGAWPAISRARGAPPTRWTLTGCISDILEWELAR